MSYNPFLKVIMHWPSDWTSGVPGPDYAHLCTPHRRYPKIRPRNYLVTR